MFFKPSTRGFFKLFVGIRSIRIYSYICIIFMREEIINTKNQAIARISEAKDASELEHLRIDYLGRSGKITQFIKRLKDLNSDEKREVGILVNVME